MLLGSRNCTCAQCPLEDPGQYEAYLPQSLCPSWPSVVLALVLTSKEVWKEWLEKEAAGEKGGRGSDSKDKESTKEGGGSYNGGEDKGEGN